jgi:hypothetical protein
MTKQLLAILVMSAFLLAGCGGESGDSDTAARDVTESVSVADAYKEMREKRGELTSTEEKLAMTKEFLEKHPEGDHVAGSIYAVYYYQGYQLEDKPAAIKYAESFRKGITDKMTGLAVDKRLLEFYADAEMTDKMVALADGLAEDGSLDFDDYWNVIEGAVKTSDWELVRGYCAKAGGLTGADAIRAENPDHEYTKKELAEETDHRNGMLLVKDGWARANLGEPQEALTDFAKADKLVPRYYFDVPEYDLNVYWGNTLLMTGNFEEAADRFATYGLVMRNEESLAGLKKAYVGLHGSEDGYDNYANKLHLSIATTIDDFEMPDYVGNRHRFSDLRSDVTLLSLWFPT